MINVLLPKGAVSPATVGPKIVSTFVPAAAARCALPVSLEITMSLRFMIPRDDTRSDFAAKLNALPFFSSGQLCLQSSLLPE